MKWDAIIIGSGLGSMTTGLELAKAGKKILIIEQHNIPGGYATSFKRNNFIFDVSLHQMAGLTKGKILYKVLDKLGVMQHVTPIPLNEIQTVQTKIGDICIDSNFIESLINLFPEDVNGLREIKRDMKRISRQLMLAISAVNKNQKLLKLFTPTIEKTNLLTLEEYLDEKLDNEMLKKLFAIQTGYFSTPANEISAFFYLMALSQYFDDGIFYIKGTSQSLSNSFIHEIKQNGGDILLNHRVERIITKDGNVEGVSVSDIKKGVVKDYFSPIIVAGTDPNQLFNKLTPDYDFPENYLDKTNGMNPGQSATCFFVGMNCELQKLTGKTYHSIAYLDNCNLPGCDFEVGGWTDYSSIDHDLAPKGKTTLSAIGGDNYDEWATLSPEKYKEKKEIYKNAFLNFMDEKIPGFKQHVEYIEVGTPLTMNRYTSNLKGAFNGYTYSIDRLRNLEGGLGSKTPLNGLYLTGAWSGSISGGFAGSILSGSLVGLQILKEKRNV